MNCEVQSTETNYKNMPPEQKTHITHRRNLALFLIGLKTLPSVFNTIPIYATRLRQLFSLNAEQYGTLIGTGTFGRIPALLMVGPLVAYFGVRRVVEFAIIGVGFTFLTIGILGNLTSFQIAMPSQGFFSGISIIAFPAFLISLYPALKRRMVSVMLVASAAPGILTPLMANELLKWSAQRDNIDFSAVLRLPFLVAGSLLILGGMILLSRKNLAFQTEIEKPHPIHLTELLRPRSLIIVLLISLHTAADGTLYFFVPMFMEHHFDHLPIAAAWALSGHNIAYVLSRSSLSALPEGVGQRSILSLAGPIGGIIIILTLWFGPAVSVPLLYALASLAFAAEFPALISEISSKSMAEFGSIMSGGMIISSLVMFVFLKGTGYIVDLTNDYRFALTIAACGFIIFGLLATLSGLGIRIKST